MSKDFQWNGQVSPYFRCFTDNEAIKQAQERIEKQLQEAVQQAADRSYTRGYQQAMIDISTGFQTLDDCHRIAKSAPGNPGRNG